jgi:Ribonuclease G/E
VGNIYAGSVTSVIPGTQSCFVNIGLERNAVLYAKDHAMPAAKTMQVPGAASDGAPAAAHVAAGAASAVAAPESHAASAAEFAAVSAVSHASAPESAAASAVSHAASAAALPSPQPAQPHRGLSNARPIETLLRVGQKIVVQVIKDAYGGKGARVTTKLSFPGRYMVLLPDSDQAAISRRISEPSEQGRLFAYVRSHMPAGCGLIARTEAKGVDEALFDDDIAAVLRMREEFRKREAAAKIPARLYEGVNFYDDIYFQLKGKDVARALTDSEEIYGALMRRTRIGMAGEAAAPAAPASQAAAHAGLAAAASAAPASPVATSVAADAAPDAAPAATSVAADAAPVAPAVAAPAAAPYCDALGVMRKIQLYSDPYPIFAFFGIQHEIRNLSSRKIWLKCGAYIVIDQTEAMTVIDVNSGKYNGRHNPGSTILRVNTEAVVESAKQLRLRDIGGVIVIDAIRMSSPEHGRAVIEALEGELRKDPRKSVVAGFTRLGLLEMTRKKMGSGISGNLALVREAACGSGLDFP